TQTRLWPGARYFLTHCGRDWRIELEAVSASRPRGFPVDQTEGVCRGGALRRREQSPPDGQPYFAEHAERGHRRRDRRRWPGDYHRVGAAVSWARVPARP